MRLSPKGTTRLWDDERLFFADIASPGTVANLAANPYVEVNVVDPIVRKGFRFKGIATVYQDGDMYDRGLEMMRAQGSTAGRERVRSIVVIDVTDAAELISPAYDDGTPETEITRQWLDYYTELHRRDDRRPHAAGHS
jgi:predicted pyridoxine 5'-phosphate oxidase superfamily flavin-nucleotide-binding protein